LNSISNLSSSPLLLLLLLLLFIPFLVQAAVGNVTGSNAVNVFLGLGLPWFIAGAFWEFGSFDNDEKLTWYKAYKDVAELKKLCDLEGIQDDGSTASNDA
jgi:hypothetical protein